ncbi:MAG: cobalt-precorrin 5A hydrolase [Lachnospira sp.]|nr:cobalt-precorrin 5A hydrolase [Lachnospira sp.]
MRTVIITFTHEGMKVAKKASTVTDGEVTIYCHKRCADDYKENAVPFDTVGSVIKSRFASSDRILFVCAAAIAVRTIAPYLKSKVTDPAVLVADESGKFLISLLSGHIGGANGWCEKLADSIGAIPVITTATDTRGMFAVDLFATSHNMRIVNPVMIQDISGRILNGEPVGITGDETFSGLLKETEKQWNGQITFTDNINGDYESGVQIITHADENVVFKRTLKLVPKNLAVGIGCKRGKSAREIEQAVKKALAANNLMPEGIAVVASVDRKADEQGIIEFAEKWKVPYKTFTPEYLSKIEGEFTSSAFVNEQIGVDNVCERSACAVSGGGEKLAGKTADNGITVAIYKMEHKLEMS